MAANNPFEMACKQLDTCAEILKLDKGVHEVLRHLSERSTSPSRSVWTTER